MPATNINHEARFEMAFFNTISEPTKPSQSPPPDWATKMLRDYAQTRSCRTEDVRRVLGDQTQATSGGAVEVARNEASLAAGSAKDPD